MALFIGVIMDTLWRVLFVCFILAPFIAMGLLFGEPAWVVMAIIFGSIGFMLFGKCLECRVVSGSWPWEESDE